MAEASWPGPAHNARAVDDAEYEQLGSGYGFRYGGVGGEALDVVFGDSSGRQVKIKAERHATVRGYHWYSGSADFVKPIDANTSGSTRTDLVVLRLTRSTWNVTTEIVKGAPGAGAPALTQQFLTTGVFELPLAEVTVVNNATNISSGDVRYVAPHILSDSSGYMMPLSTALNYVPQAYNGQIVRIPGGKLYRRESNVWVPYFGWQDFTPVLTNGNRSVVASTKVRGRFRRIDDTVWAQAHVTANGGSNGGCHISLPVAAPARNFGLGTLAIYGSSPPADQCGIAGMTFDPPFDRLVVIAFTNGFRDVVSGQEVRYSVCYDVVA